MAIEWDNFVILTMRDEKFEKEFKKKYFIFWWNLRKNMILVYIINNLFFLFKKIQFLER